MARPGNRGCGVTQADAGARRRGAEGGGTAKTHTYLSRWERCVGLAYQLVARQPEPDLAACHDPVGLSGGKGGAKEPLRREERQQPVQELQELQFWLLGSIRSGSGNKVDDAPGCDDGL